MDDELIKLPGVSSVDLDRFLSLIYPSYVYSSRAISPSYPLTLSELASCDLETPDEWISALRLAHRWSFPALRVRAIQEIQLGGSAVDRVAAAREFSDLSSLQDWLLPSFMEACTTSCWLDAVSADDAERLGAGTVLQIARIREKVSSLTYGYVDVERAIVDAGLAPEASVGGGDHFSSPVDKDTGRCAMFTSNGSRPSSSLSLRRLAGGSSPGGNRASLSSSGSYLYLRQVSTCSGSL